MPIKYAGGYKLDDTGWPLLIVTAPPEQTDEQMAEYLDAIFEFYQRFEPHVLIMDISQGKGLTAKQRQMQAEYINKRTAHNNTILGAAFVANTAFRRGVLTAIFWLSSPPWPYVVVATMKEARAWADDKLKAVDSQSAAG